MVVLDTTSCSSFIKRSLNLIQLQERIRRLKPQTSVKDPTNPLTSISEIIDLSLSVRLRSADLKVHITARLDTEVILTSDFF